MCDKSVFTVNRGAVNPGIILVNFEFFNDISGTCFTMFFVLFQAQQEDQWAYIVGQFPTEKAVRWRYDMTKREFFSDEVEVKIDDKVVFC